MNKTNWLNYWDKKNIWTGSDLWKKNIELFFQKTSNIFDYNKDILSKNNVNPISNILREIPGTDKDLGYHFKNKEWIKYREKSLWYRYSCKIPR